VAQCTLIPGDRQTPRTGDRQIPDTVSIDIGRVENCKMPRIIIFLVNINAGIKRTLIGKLAFYGQNSISKLCVNEKPQNL
jgi:hypothetical protein